MVYPTRQLTPNGHGPLDNEKKKALLFSLVSENTGHKNVHRRQNRHGTARAGLAINDNGVLIRTSLENEHEPLKSNQALLWAVFNEEQEKWFWFFCCSGSTFDRLDRAVSVGIGLGIAL